MGAMRDAVVARRSRLVYGGEVEDCDADVEQDTVFVFDLLERGLSEYRRFCFAVGGIPDCQLKTGRRVQRAGVLCGASDSTPGYHSCSYTKYPYKTGPDDVGNQWFGNAQ